MTAALGTRSRSCFFQSGTAIVMDAGRDDPASRLSGWLRSQYLVPGAADGNHDGDRGELWRTLPNVGGWEESDPCALAAQGAGDRRYGL